MCKPSKHLIEYIENQNLEVQSIISNLPDELPIRDAMENEKVVENKSNDNTEVKNVEPVIIPLSTNTVENSVTTTPTINPVPLTPTITPVVNNVAPSMLTKLEE